MRLKNLNDKQKLAMIIGLAVLTLAATIFLFSKTVLKGIRITKSQLSTLQMRIIEVKRAQEDIKKFEAELISVQVTLAQVNEKLPGAKEVPELLSKLAELAATFPGKDYISLTPRNPDDLGKYYKLPFTINIRCSYTELRTYLQKLENLPRLIKIETLQINPSGDNPAILMVRLEINVYYLKSEQSKT